MCLGLTDSNLNNVFKKKVKTANKKIGVFLSYPFLPGVLNGAFFNLNPLNNFLMSKHCWVWENRS